MTDNTPAFRDDFLDFLTYRALEFRYQHQNLAAVDHVIERARGDAWAEHGIEIQNLCAKVPKALVDQLNERCDLLGISKRQFIEFAIHEGLNLADQIIEEYGLVDQLVESGCMAGKDEAA